MTEALICGAGVGGLASGVYLDRAGFDVRLFEQSPELRTAGVGINIWPNGVAAIYGMGLREEYEAISASVSHYRTVTDKGVEISVVDVSDWSERYGAPLTGVHRKDLNAMLAENLGFDHINFEHRLARFDDDGDAVKVDFENGVQASADFLVAADGVYSVVRPQLLGEDVAMRTDNLVRWRGVFSLEEAGVPPTFQQDAIGEKGHFGWIPIGKGLAYWFSTGEGLEDWDAFFDYFGSWHKTPVPAIIDATPIDTRISNTLLEFVEHLDSWGVGRVTLLGDACHPMLPGMAQGANQALDDARALAACMREASDVESGLRAYEQIRAPRAHLVVELSRRLFEFEESYAALAPGAPNPIVDRFVEHELAEKQGTPR
jgi:2-polyprenyl-6-methoxyphenol hydroxylase-like FAD-dependent oxidoreductase